MAFKSIESDPIDFTRVYDPALGRFTQADPYIQDPTHSQSLNRYSYVDNNPLKYTDPSGYKKIWKQKWFRETAKIVAIAVAAVYTGGVAANAFWGSSTAAGLAGTTGSATVMTTTAGVITGATGGFTAGLLASGGEIKPAVRGGVTGGVLGGFGGTGVLGRMTGSGVNGYLQTGTAEGFARGFAAGAIPNDLGLSAYYTNSVANIGIGIARDGLHGGIIRGRDGVLPGIAYGQINNAVGHLIGFVSGEYKGFNNGAFLYEKPEGGGITFGNVIVGGRDFLGYPTLVAHERDHIFNQVEQGFGVLYGPIHALDLLIGKGGELLGYGCSGYVIEQHVNVHPYASIGHPCAY